MMIKVVVNEKKLKKQKTKLKTRAETAINL